MGEVLQTRAGRPAAGDYCDPETGELTDDGYKLVRRAAGLGLTKHQIAILLGMHVDTFVDRRRKFPEIDRVIELGKSEADLAVSNALYKRATAGDMAAIRWYEMTRTSHAAGVEAPPQEATVYVIQAPPKVSEEEWEARHSPVTIDGHSTDITE